MITGESGTGKELVARALHSQTARASKRFEAVNCGAMPENLLEAELFGYKKGAFTGAHRDTKGLFETCTNGTLLLDEVGEMPLSSQVKLLRVLQEGEVRPIGSNSSIKVNTRVLSSTHKSLKSLAERGLFRHDLYFRLSVLEIRIPALRDRREDIPQW